MSANNKFDFGTGLKELEAITAWFESEQVDLDEGLKKFERGMELAAQLKAHLAAVENRVQTIKAQQEAEGLAGEAPVTPESDNLFN